MDFLLHPFLSLFCKYFGHNYKRIRTPFGDGRVCRRCGNTVAVKHRVKQEGK